MGNHQSKSLHEIESEIDGCFVDLMNNVTQMSIDPSMVFSYDNSFKNHNECKKLIYKIHKMFKSKKDIDNITSVYIPKIIAYLNAIHVTYNSLPYYSTSIKLLKHLTDLLNTYIHMRSNDDDKLKSLEDENRRLREENARLNQNVIANIASIPPQQFVQKPTAPPIEKTNCNAIIEL